MRHSFLRIFLPLSVSLHVEGVELAETGAESTGVAKQDLILIQDARTAKKIDIQLRYATNTFETRRLNVEKAILEPL